RGIPSDSAFIEVDEPLGAPGDYLKISITSTVAQSAVARLRTQFDVWRSSHPCTPIVDAGAGDARPAGYTTNGGCACQAGRARHTAPASLAWIIGALLFGVSWSHARRPARTTPCHHQEASRRL